MTDPEPNAVSRMVASTLHAKRKVQHVVLMPKDWPENGHLIRCTRCLDKDHLAPWRNAKEMSERLDSFAEKHRNCRP